MNEKRLLFRKLNNVIENLFNDSNDFKLIYYTL